MKLLMLLGAILGFAIGFAFSLLQQSPWPRVVWHACVGAYLAGMLLRWWGRLWEKNLRLALVEREAATVRGTNSAKSTKP